MPGVYFSKTVILGLILLSPRLSGVVLSCSSRRGDGNPNLKGSQAFQHPEDRHSVLQLSPAPSPVPLRAQGAGKPLSQSLKLHLLQGTHRSVELVELEKPFKIMESVIKAPPLQQERNPWNSTGI